MSIYWRDIGPDDRVYRHPDDYLIVNGTDTPYWHSQERAQAQQFLRGRAEPWPEPPTPVPPFRVGIASTRATHWFLVGSRAGGVNGLDMATPPPNGEGETFPTAVDAHRAGRRATQRRLGPVLPMVFDATGRRIADWEIRRMGFAI